MDNVLSFRKEKKKPITPELRYKIFTVADGVDGNLYNVHRLLSFVHHERMLDWLIQNKITGKKFKQWFLYEHKMNIIDMGSFIIAKINKDKEVKPVYAKKDFIVD